MNSKDNLFIFGQITFGFLIDDTVIGDAVPIGLTLGKRWYKMEKNHGINIIILMHNCGYLFHVKYFKPTPHSWGFLF